MFLNFNLIEKRERFFKRNFLIAALFTVSLGLAGCGGSAKKTRKTPQKQTATTLMLKDTLYSKVKTMKDSLYSYALYIPDKEGVLPLLFFFDAHARGALPVKKYRTLADKYGFILACSNNSKNGMQSAERNSIIYNFMEDVEKRTGFDPNRIYVSGFSGGARIASGIGLSNRNIAAVIACAAGFPQTDVQPSPDFTFVGIVGNKDFNYLEMGALDRQLEGIKRQHTLLVFDGKHEWPPKETMEKAFRLLQLQAMQKGILKKDTSFIAAFANNSKSKINKDLQANNLPKADALCEREESFLQGLINLAPCKKQLESIEKNPAFNKQRYAIQLLEEREQKSQQKLLRGMEVKDSIWWKKELNQLVRNVTHLKNREERLMNRRLLNYLSLISYLYADRTLKEHDNGEAAKFLLIYETSDPDNPEVYFMKAELYASTGKPNKVLPALSLALDKGFDEPQRIIGNPYFHPFYNNEGFRKIVEKVKNNEDSSKLLKI